MKDQSEKPNPELINGENPEWTAEQIAKARPAREVLLQILRRKSRGKCASRAALSRKVLVLAVQLQLAAPKSAGQSLSWSVVCTFFEHWNAENICQTLTAEFGSRLISETAYWKLSPQKFAECFMLPLSACARAYEADYIVGFMLQRAPVYGVHDGILAVANARWKAYGARRVESDGSTSVYRTS